MLNEKLKEIRKQHNLTQQQIAEYLGVTQSTYAYYETGRNEPDLETLKKIADFYKCSTDYLLGRYN